MPLSLMTNSLRKPGMSPRDQHVAAGDLRSQRYSFHFGCFAAASSRSLRKASCVWFSSQVSLAYLPLPASSAAGASRPRLHREDAVLRGVARADRVDQLLAVVGEQEFDDVGDGAFGAIGQGADHQVRAELRPRTATGCTRRRAAASAASTLLIALGLRRRCRGGPPPPAGASGPSFRYTSTPDAFSGIAKRFTRSMRVAFPEARSTITMPSFGAGFLSFFALSISAFDGNVEKTSVLLSAEKFEDGAASLRRRPFFARRRRRGRGPHSRGLALLLAGDQIADDHFAIAFLREEPVGQKLSVVGELLADDGPPAVVVAVVEGPLALGKRHRNKRRSSQQPRGHTKGTSPVKHDVGIVIHGRTGFSLSTPACGRCVI